MILRGDAPAMDARPAGSRVAGSLATTVQEKVTPMTEQNRTRTDTAQSKTMKSAAVTPSDHTERPDGLAFDIETGADLPGVPVGDQTPRNPDAARTEEVVRETGEGVGLAVPQDPDPKSAESSGDTPAEG
jgi:hypothetical protein